MGLKEPEERELVNPWAICDIEKREWATVSPK